MLPWSPEPATPTPARADAPPLGLINYAGASALPGVGTLNLDGLHDAIGIALGNNADPNRMRWMLRSEVFVNLRKQKDSSACQEPVP